MKNVIMSMAALGVLATGSAHAVNLATGLYSSIGTVASTNGASTCSSVGLVKGAANDSVLKYPGIGKTGLTIYVPLSGVEQLCSGFPAVPSGGLNGFNGNANCTIYTSGGTIPNAGVNFVFSSTVADANSAIGTITVTIPSTAAVGAGCSAVIDTTTVRSGK